MQQLWIEIPPELDGLRADRALPQLLDEYSRSFVQQLLEEQHILLSDRPLKKSRTVKAGERFFVEIPDPVLSEILPEDIPLNIVYEDEDLLVVNKEKGMVVHPAPGHFSGTLVNALLYHCGDRLSSINGVIRPGIVHRIDMDTSGLLVVAKNDAAHRSLAEQIKEHTSDRYYEAVVYGLIPETGTVDAPIGRNPTDRKKMAVNFQNGKAARTHFSRLAAFNGYSHVQCRLETGRTHQIRVHMASIGHPVVNDPLYFSGRDKLKYDFSGQCLHAKTIGFVHPQTGEKMHFDSALPQYFLQLLTKLEKM